ncbi:hypothetical protein ACS6KF_23180 [Enterobacter hormaechei subsp. steigerwaltii]
MSYKVDQAKILWTQLSDAEKKEFTTYLFDKEKNHYVKALKVSA